MRYRRRPLLLRVGFWLVLAAVALLAFLVLAGSGLSRVGLAGMQAAEICQRGGLGYDAAGAMAPGPNRWPFSYRCGATTNTVPVLLNVSIVAVFAIAAISLLAALALVIRSWLMRTNGLRRGDEEWTI